MFKEIANLTVKNFKLAFRTKTAIVTLLVAPIIILFLLAAAFNNTADVNINVGLHAEEYTDLANQLVDNLGESNFELTKIDSEEECINQVKQEAINLCMVFPNDLAIEEGKTNEIIFHIDPSKTNSVARVIDVISSKLAPTSEEISLNLTSNILEKIELTKSTLEENKKTIEELQANIDKLQKHTSEIDRAVTASKESSNLPIDAVANSSRDVQDNVEDLQKTLKNKVSAIEKEISGASNNVDDLPDSSTKTKLEDNIKDLEADLDILDNAAEQFDNSTEDQFSAINTFVTEMDTKLDRIVAILGKIEEEKAGAIPTLNETEDQVAQLDKDTTSLLAAMSSVSITDADNIVNPFTTTIKPVVVDRSHLNLVYAGIIMMIVMFVAILLSSTIVMMERKSKSYLLNYLTPAKDISFVLSMYITIMVLLLLQSAILVGISAFFFGAQITTNLPQIALVLFITLTFFVLLGMLVAYFFNAEQTITLVSIALGSLFLLLSNVILPIELMPRAFQQWVMFNPFLLAESALKRIMQFDASFANISGEVITLAIYAAIMFFLILLVEGLLKRKGLIKFFKAFSKNK